MNKSKISRGVARGAFTRQVTSLKELLCEEDLDLEKIQNKFELLSERFEKLKILDESVYAILLEEGETEKLLLEETTACDEYADTFIEVKNSVKKLFRVKSLKSSDSLVSIKSTVVSKQSNDNDMTENKNRNFKLPKIKIDEYNGDIKNWLKFWGQFEKVDQDKRITEDDKFQYLLQATEPGSKARAIVESFPHFGRNYKNALQSLKARCGREDLLIEVYTRELLKLVMLSSAEKTSTFLISQYDKLESLLRALETFGVTSDKCSHMLLPMVESCLPEELLRLWQRSNNSKSDDHSDKLKNLLNFVRAEVEAEEKIVLAKEGFGQGTSSNPCTSYNTRCSTAASLVSTKAEKRVIKEECVFCSKAHRSIDCFNARKMTIEEKRKILKEKKRCFICFSASHFNAKQCRVAVRCFLCNKRHQILMCPDTATRSQVVDTTVHSPKGNGSHSMASVTKPEVFLQTLLVRVSGANNKSLVVRAILDTGSQRSYITESVAKLIDCEFMGTDTINHNLFGGSSSGERVHNCYKLFVSNLENSFTCDFEVIDQSVICGEINPVRPGPWLKELQQSGIKLSDVDQSAGPVGLLIGSDIAGRLLTGSVKDFKNGLVAVETKLGWTLMGKVPKVYSQRDTLASGLVSLLTCEEKIRNLGNSDVLGMSDPVVRISKLEQDIQNYSTDQRIQWIFNPPTSPWWGGWWERLVRVVKDLLRRVLSQASLDFVEMCTVLCECEAVINLRPLTYVSEDSLDFKPLKPNLLMFGKNRSFGTVNIDEIDANKLNSRLNYKQKLILDLRNRFHRQIGNKPKYSIKVGDVVLIGQDNVKKVDWPMGRVIELPPSPDGEVRVVSIQLGLSHGRRKIIRPVQRVYSSELTFLSKVDAKEGEELQQLLSDKTKAEGTQRQHTRSGRIVKPPERFK